MCSWYFRLFIHNLSLGSVRNRGRQPLTVFENYSKCLILILEFWHFPPIFVLLKLTCLVTLFDRNLQVFQKLAKMDHLSTQNVNVARFARNVEWDFFCYFQTPWVEPIVILFTAHKKNSLRSCTCSKAKSVKVNFGSKNFPFKNKSRLLKVCCKQTFNHSIGVVFVSPSNIYSDRLLLSN